MEMLILLPVLLPFAGGISLLALKDYLKAQLYGNAVVSLLSLITAVMLFTSIYTDGIFSVQLGGWEAPFGITFVADLLGSVMVLITAIIGFTTSIYSLASVDDERVKYGYYPLIQFLLMGINGAFLTGDIFNLYVWFEVMLISSFVLLSLGGTREQLEGAIKYVTLNLLSSAFFLAAIGIIYGLAGTLNMADLALKFSTIENDGMVTVVSMLLFIAFGIKSAVFPLFFWLPASYHTPPAAVSAIFAGLLTKVGVYALFRVFTLLFTNNTEYTHTILLIVAGFTMLSGVLGAAAQNDFRRILSFHIISQIGYMIMGLALYSPLAIAGGIFYIIHHIIVKTNLFFISGYVNKIKGSYELKKVGGLYKIYPWLGFLFLIPAMSLAGIPPLSGFWAKFTVAKAGLELESYLIVGVSLFVGLLTLFSMTKIWNEAFWTDSPEDAPADVEPGLFTKISMLTPVIILAVITITIGLFAEPFFNFSVKAADQLLNSGEYINTVLGGGF